MSVKLNYDGTNNILFINAATHSDPSESIAIDVLRVIFQSILESSIRLEEKLFHASTLDKQDDSHFIFFSSTIGDVWSLIDGIRRLEKILEYIPGIPTELEYDLNAIFQEIRLVRNSFQHLDERISSHFSKVGGSAFGDLLWRFRKERGERESLICLISGTSKQARQVDLGIGPEQPKFLNSTGIYDVWLLYIEKNGSQVRVSIDIAVEKINVLLEFLEDKYSRVYERLDMEKKTDHLPYTFQLRVTQEAFDKVNNRPK